MKIPENFEERDWTDCSDHWVNSWKTRALFFSKITERLSLQNWVRKAKSRGYLLSHTTQRALVSKQNIKLTAALNCAYLVQEVSKKDRKRWFRLFFHRDNLKRFLSSGRYLLTNYHRLKFTADCIQPKCTELKYYILIIWQSMTRF